MEAALECGSRRPRPRIEAGRDAAILSRSVQNAREALDEPGHLALKAGLPDQQGSDRGAPVGVLAGGSGPARRGWLKDRG